MQHITHLTSLISVDELEIIHTKNKVEDGNFENWKQRLRDELVKRTMYTLMKYVIKL